MVAAEACEQKACLRVRGIAAQDAAQQTDRFTRSTREDVMLCEALERNGARGVELDRGLHRRDCEVVVSSASVRRTERELDRRKAGRDVARTFEQIDRGSDLFAVDEQE